MGLNSKGEGLWLTDSILLIRGMHGVTESTSLNWLFGVSCMLLMLSSCVLGGSDSISGDAIGSSVYISLDRGVLHAASYMILQNLFCRVAPFIVLSSSFALRSLYEAHTKECGLAQALACVGRDVRFVYLSVRA